MFSFDNTHPSGTHGSRVSMVHHTTPLPAFLNLHGTKNVIFISVFSIEETDFV